jgi:hypothetical protein
MEYGEVGFPPEKPRGSLAYDAKLLSDILC